MEKKQDMNQTKNELIKTIESIKCESKLKIIYIFVKSYLSSFRS